MINLSDWQRKLSSRNHHFLIENIRLSMSNKNVWKSPVPPILELDIAKCKYLKSNLLKSYKSTINIKQFMIEPKEVPGYPSNLRYLIRNKKFNTQSILFLLNKSLKHQLSHTPHKFIIMLSKMLLDNLNKH